MFVSAFTGPLDPETSGYAEEIFGAFMAELGKRGVLAIASLANESVGERFIYRVSRAGRAVLVQVPGVPLARIRTDGDATGAELHVDGIGLAWKAALDRVAERLGIGD